MSFFKLVLRSLRHYRRQALTVILGAAVSAAVLTGALMVGDSVKGSLQDMALQRIGRTQSALIGREHFFTLTLADKLEDSAPVLAIRGIVSVRGGQQRLSDINFYGIVSGFNSMAFDSSVPALKEGECAINQSLSAAMDIKIGEEILLRFEKADQLSRDLSFVADKDMNKALRLKVVHIRTVDQFGNFSLAASQTAPLNVFISLKELGAKLGIENKANLLIAQMSADELEMQVAPRWTLDDGGLHLKKLEGRDIIELTSDRVFLRPRIAEAALSYEGYSFHVPSVEPPRQFRIYVPPIYPVCSYFINRAESNAHVSPYFFGASDSNSGDDTTWDDRKLPAKHRITYVKPILGDDEVIINKWLAEDLHVADGDKIKLFWYKPGLRRELVEESAEFTIRRIIPVNNVDRDLMLPIPGLKDADSCSEWDPAIPVDLDLIRDKDEKYWDDYRGTPKIYLSISGAQKHWSNQFGNTTAVRYRSSLDGMYPGDIQQHLRSSLAPSDFGVTIRDIRGPALAAGKGATDFGGLFAGLGMFIIAAALILTGILFAFMIENRAEETGLYLALGLRPGTIRRLFMAEAFILSLCGVLLGIPLGIAYVKGILWALSTMWAGAVGRNTVIGLHIAPMTLLIGSLSALVLNLITIRLVLRRLLKKSPVSLQSGAASLSSPVKAGANKSLIIGLLCILSTLILILLAGPTRGRAAVGAFFGVGALLLIGGILIFRFFLYSANLKSKIKNLKFLKLSSNLSRQLAVIALLASGLFVTVAVAANYADPMSDLQERRSGTGGFSLYGGLSLPFPDDMNSAEGRKKLMLDAPDFKDVSFVHVRVKSEDDASCLNLNQVIRPSLAGVDPAEFMERGAFTFVKLAEGINPRNPWSVLSPSSHLPNSPSPQSPVLPAVVDSSVLTWQLKKKLGDIFEYQAADGSTVKVRIAGVIQDSIFQGHLLISEKAFADHFPGAGGTSIFLADVPSDLEDQVTRRLAIAFEDRGLRLQSAAERLGEFMAVQNTYLMIFLLLGGLGIILGSVGLGIVVLRNALERRAELALLRAVGFTRRRLRSLLLKEHAVLLTAGVGLGLISGLAASLPAMLSPGLKLPLIPILFMTLAVFINGFVWVYIASRIAMSGELLTPLREE